MCSFLPQVYIFLKLLLGILFCSGCNNKMPSTGWLKPQIFIFHSSGVWKVHSVPSETLLPGSQTATSHYNLTRQKQLSGTSYRGTNLIYGGSIPDLITFQGLTSKQSPVGVRFQQVNWKGHKHLVYATIISLVVDLSTGPQGSAAALLLRAVSRVTIWGQHFSTSISQLCDLGQLTFSVSVSLFEEWEY